MLTSTQTADTPEAPNVHWISNVSSEQAVGPPLLLSPHPFYSYTPDRDTEVCVAVGAVCTWGGFLQDVPAIEGSLLLLAQVGAMLQQPMGDPALTNAWKEAEHGITTGFAPTRGQCAHFHSENEERPLSLQEL